VIGSRIIGCFWIYKAHETVTLPSLGVHFPLRDAYLDIEIEEISLEEESDHETN
jgi:hypothetical protein